MAGGADVLADVVWHALSGDQRALSEGNEAVRRYARGFSPIIAFADPQGGDIDALRPWCEPGEHFYTAQWTAPVPVGWRLDGETTMRRMRWEAPLPPEDPAPDATPLGREHAAEAMALAELTRPGPFGPRTIELGDYFGYFEGGHLIAMAGERMRAGRFREVSGVCTHPDCRGKGHAARLMLKLVRRAMLRGETSFLHVMSDNAVAHALYQRLGFRDYREVAVRVVTLL